MCSWAWWPLARVISDDVYDTSPQDQECPSHTSVSRFTFEFRNNSTQQKFLRAEKSWKLMELEARRKLEDNVAQEGIDRINGLQDEILSQISSFLPTEDNVRASFVCTRWKSLWSPSSVLDLDCERFCKIFKNSSQESQKEKFTDFVNSMFLLHQHRQLEELRLSFNLSVLGVTNLDIDNWVFSAMTIGSTKLDLEFTSVHENGDFKLYKLPRVSSVIRSVTVMKLNLCKFVPRRYTCFESLKTVILRDVELLKNAVHDLIDRCPVLEELHLIDCTVCSDFDSEFYVSASKLKCLVLDFSYGFEGHVHSVDIRVPSLLKFKYVGDLLDDFSVGDFDNLIEADIYFTDACFSFDHSMSIHNMIGSLSDVNTLTLCPWSLKLLGTVLYDPSELLENLPYPFSNLKHLTLHSCLGDSDLEGLHRLVRSSPSIETLSIKLSPGYYPDKFWESQSVPFDCLQHLKKIEMQGFYGLKSEMEFLKYMLGTALVLKKVIICKAAFQSRCISKEQDEIDKPLFFARQEKAIEVLLGFRKASPDAQILLSSS